jgi:DNA invertase Pin-like site-specific DNA recombinase
VRLESANGYTLLCDRNKDGRPEANRTTVKSLIRSDAMATLPKPSDREHSTTGEIVPAVVYAAKSTDDVRGSIGTQVADCEAMSKREGWSVADVYSDEAKSAYHGSRGDGLAKACEHAAQLAVECGESMLVVQHTDRLARGDGRGKAQHLVEVWAWARKTGVRVRSVEDDVTFENPVMAAMMGERNFEDSRRKAAATAAGRRRAAERGEWCGAVPDGYEIERTPHGATIVRRVVMHPERREVYRLLWDMAIDRATVNDIVRELAARGYRTAPRRARPCPFDATRVGKALINPFYAGLMVSQREIIGAGDWPAYVEPDVWYRVRQERTGRSRHRPEPVGRPPTSLLARLARCECGAAMIQQRGGLRKDGTRKRTYVCVTHMHRRDDCPALPYDAEQVERMVIGGLDKLLGDAGAWADSLLAGREAERARLLAEVDEAEHEAKECERVVVQLAGKYEAAVIAGDDAEVALSKQAWEGRRQTAKRAALRQQAATGALAGLVEQPEGDADVALARMWEALSGELDAVKDERAALNAALRRWFERFELHRDADGQLRVVPIFSIDAARELVRLHPPCSPPATSGPIHKTSWSLFTPGNASHEAVKPFEQVVGYVPMASHGTGMPLPVDELADEPLDRPQFRISVTTDALTAETSGQPGRQPQSLLPHNTRQGS